MNSISISNLKILFMGTPEFAIPAFNALLKANYKVVAVITAPDAPIGRKQIITSPPIKIEAKKNNIPVLQPEKIKDIQWIQKIKKLNPDLIIVCAFGQIIPKEILDIPKFGAINIHPSLLPKYRGASPIQYTILNNEKETGITIILMDEQMDHGPIITNSKLKIKNEKITYKELTKELSELAAKLLIKTLPKWINKKIKPQEQNHNEATFTKIIKKEDGKIDWNNPAEKIDAQIRALNPWPGTYSIFNGKSIKILEAETIKTDEKLPTGKVFKINNDIVIKCGVNALKIKTIQIESKKPIDIKSFINGYPNFINSILK